MVEYDNVRLLEMFHERMKVVQRLATAGIVPTLRGIYVSGTVYLETRTMSGVMITGDDA
jgi:hypothetical protein